MFIANNLYTNVIHVITRRTLKELLQTITSGRVPNWYYDFVARSGVASVYVTYYAATNSFLETHCISQYFFPTFMMVMNYLVTVE